MEDVDRSSKDNNSTTYSTNARKGRIMDSRKESSRNGIDGDKR